MMQRRLHLFWPLFLMAAGAVWILINLGRLPAANLWALTYLWPIVLIAAGLGLILRGYWQYARVVLDVLSIGALLAGVLLAPQYGWDRVPSAGYGSGWFLGRANQQGSGHVVSETRKVSDFTSVHVDYPATVTIRQGSGESLTINAEDNVAASIRTQVTNGVLEIDSLNDHEDLIVPTKPVNITIEVKDLKELDFNSAGTVLVTGLKTETLTLTLDGAGDIRLQEPVVTSLVCQLHGVGSVNANGGKADQLTVRVDGLGSFNGAELAAQTATVTLDGLGSAELWAVRTLTAHVNGMGSVSYWGDPQVTKSINGLGSVNAKGAR